MTKTETNNKLKNAKMIARFVTIRCVSVSTAALLVQNVATTNKIQKIQLLIGAACLADIAADKTWDHMEKQIDEVVDAVRAAKSEIDQATTSV